MRSLVKISLIIILFSMFFSFGLIRAETSTVLKIDSHAEELNLQSSNYDLLNFFADQQNILAQLNRDYLSIILISIFGLFGLLSILFYLINIRPSQKEIKEQKEELKTIKEKLKENFSELTNKQEKDQKEFKIFSEKTIASIKKQELKIRSRLEVQELSLRAHKSMSLALHSELFRDYSKVFPYWIDSAYYFYKLDKSHVNVLISIERAKSGLEKVTEKNTELLELLRSIKEKMSELTKQYPEVIKEIEKILEEKLKTFNK